MESWYNEESIFAEGGNRSAQRKPLKSGWDRLKLNPHTTFVVEVEDVIDVYYTSLTSQEVRNSTGYFNQMVSQPDNNSVQQGLTWVNKRKPMFSLWW